MSQQKPGRVSRMRVYDILYTTRAHRPGTPLVAVVLARRAVAGRFGLFSRKYCESLGVVTGELARTHAQVFFHNRSLA